MPKLTPRTVSCPYCGEEFTNRGYRNHVNKCKRMSETDRKLVKSVRDLRNK